MFSFQKIVRPVRPERAWVGGVIDYLSKFIASNYRRNDRKRGYQIHSTKCFTLLLLEKLNPEVNIYRFDREHIPLVVVLQNTLPTQNVPQDVLDFIINKVNIDYYM